MTSSPDPTEVRHCIKCGREIGPDESICTICNRAGMATPSPTQYHGTVAVAVVLAVVGLAIAASLSMRGVGPYAAEVTGVVDEGARGYAITFAVTNDGTSAGRAKCQVVARDASGERLGARNTVTEQIAGGSAVSASVVLPGLEDEPAEVAVTCS
jgi:hypothetical protein